MRNNKKQLYAALIIVLILFILSFVLFFLFSKFNIVNNSKVNQDVLNINFTKSKKINLKNTLPVSDELGKSFDGTGVSEGLQGYNEFSIKNTSSSTIRYEIYLTKNQIKGTELSEKYIKLYLTDGNDLALKGFDNNKLPAFSSLMVLSDMPNGFLMFRGTLNSSEEKMFRLRVWLADTYAISKNEEKFSFNINVRAV